MGSYLTDQTPQNSTKLDVTNTSTPAWMQQAIYDQIQNAIATADRPYVPYSMPTVAGLNPNQTQAYSQVQQNSTGFNSPTGMNAGLTNAATAMKAYQDSNTATGLSTGQTNYLSPNTPAQWIKDASGNWANAVKLSPSGAANVNLTSAANLNPLTAATSLVSAQALSPSTVANQYLTNSNTSAGNITSNSTPNFLNSGVSANNITASPYSALTDSLSSAGNITANANPYLTAAGQQAYTGINNYMNPYQQNVMDTMAQQAGRNLSENLLPQVSDQFIKAGQFGGNRMGEFGARALRDTQQTLLQEQGKLANQGYTQAMANAQTDLGRQATLGQTAGNLASQQAQAYQNVGQTQGQLATQQAQAYNALGQNQAQAATQQAQAYQNIGQTAGQLTSAEQQNLANIGQTQGQLTSAMQQNLANIGQTQGQLTAQEQQNLATIANQQAQQAGQQQQLGLTAAKDVQGAQAQDATRQMGALNDYTTILGNQQKMQNLDTATLEAAGQAQQAQQQAELTAAQQQWQTMQDYPKNQLDWMNAQIRGLPANTIPTITTSQTNASGQTYAPSVLQQLASGAALVKGLTGQ
jgi:hypothetical protein